MKTLNAIILALLAYIAYLLHKQQKAAAIQQALTSGFRSETITEGASTTTIESPISLSEVADAIKILARGITVPNLKTAIASVTSGKSNVAPAENGKSLWVLAYVITTDDTASGDIKFWSGETKTVYQVKLTPAAGTVGANLSVNWPSYLFRTNINEGIDVEVTGNAVITLVYWSE